MARAKKKQTVDPPRENVDGPTSAPKKTTDEERLYYKRNPSTQSAPKKTTDAERLAYRGRPQVREETGLVERTIVQSDSKERGSIVKAALKFRNRPTPSNFAHLLTLVEDLKGREEVDANEKSAEQMAWERKQVRDRAEQREALKAEIAEKEALLAETDDEPSSDADAASSDEAE